MFFSLPSWAVALLVFAVIGTATAAGYVIGRYLTVWHRSGKQWLITRNIAF